MAQATTDTFADNGAGTYQDTVVGFSQAAGDTIQLDGTGDTVAIDGDRVAEQRSGHAARRCSDGSTDPAEGGRPGSVTSGFFS